MKIKVCGLRNNDNISAISALSPDFMGFIFYDKSKRFVGENFDPDILNVIPDSVTKTGVFVNASQEYIVTKVKQYSFDLVQLHGDETPLFCSYLYKQNISICKAFRIDDSFNFEQLKFYEPFCRYFLFDTKADEYGGTGKKFNWDILTNYNLTLPFLLSGGIAATDLLEIKNFRHPSFCAIDINSKFEISPALKDVILLTNFINKVRQL